MFDSLTTFFILILAGLIAIGVVAVLYFVQKRGRMRSPWLNMHSTATEEIQELDTMSKGIDIRAALAICRDDQPVFLRVAEDLLTRVRSQSEIKVLRQVVREYEVGASFLDAKTSLLKKMKTYRETEHSYKSQPVRLQRKDEIETHTHEREIARLKNETKRFNDPPRSPENSSEPSSQDIAKWRDAERNRQLEDAQNTFEHEVRFQTLKKDILGAFEEEQRKKNITLIDRIRDDFAQRKVTVMEDSRLSPLEKEASIRALQKEFMRQLDDVEAKL